MRDKKNEIVVRVHKIFGKCKYHREVGQEYNLKNVVPEGVCFNVAHIAYAYCLGLANKAVFYWTEKTNKDMVIAQCPFGKIVMGVKREEEGKKVIVRIIEKRGECRENMEVGQEFLFNLGEDHTTICPAGFNAIYPYLLLVKNKRMRKILVECPDHINRVVYEIERRKNE